MSRIIDGVTGKFELSTPEIYVNNQARYRSGHMSHALVQYAPGKVIDFNSNCSAVRCEGHSAYGWIEYRKSEDSGQTWGEVRELPFAKKSFEDGLFTISIEKAVALSDGTIIAFCCRNTMLHSICCEPWLNPVYIKSTDGGETWSEPYEFSPARGRIYDAITVGDTIYALEFFNDAEVIFTGNKPEHEYHLFRSDDKGESFVDLGALPIESFGRAYGSMLARPDGSIVVYAYNSKDECHMDTILTRDGGVTWEVLPPCYVALGIRNPQTAILDDTYVLHGRGANSRSFVLYTSADGLTWDAGVCLEPSKSRCYYSNNIVLRDTDGRNRLLIQYSDAYDVARVNVMHMWMKACR